MKCNSNIWEIRTLYREKGDKKNRFKLAHNNRLLKNHRSFMHNKHLQNEWSTRNCFYKGSTRPYIQTLLPQSETNMARYKSMAYTSRDATQSYAWDCCANLAISPPSLKRLI